MAEAERQRRAGNKPTKVILGSRARHEFLCEVDLDAVMDTDHPLAFCEFDFLRCIEDPLKLQDYVEVA